MNFNKNDILGAIKYSIDRKSGNRELFLRMNNGKSFLIKQVYHTHNSLILTTNGPKYYSFINNIDNLNYYITNNNLVINEVIIEKGFDRIDIENIYNGAGEIIFIEKSIFKKILNKFIK